MEQTLQTLEFFLNGMLLLTWILLNFYIVAVELRFLTSWFLNINPYFEPFLSLWLWTNPVFCFGRSFYPKILGFDLAPLINFQFLYFVQARVGKYVKNVNNGAPPTPGMGSEMNPNPESGTNPESLSTPDWVYDVRDWLQNLLFKAKELVSDSTPKTESSKNFFETITFYLKKILNRFLDKLLGILNKPDDVLFVHTGPGEHSGKEYLVRLISTDTDSTVDFVSNVDTQTFAEQFSSSLSQMEILDQFHNHSLGLDLSTLLDKDFLSHLGYYIVDNFFV